MLFPQDLLNPKRVDDHFSEEAAVLKDLGHTVLKVDLEALERGDYSQTLRFPSFTHPERVGYRGWMLTPSSYTKLGELLDAKGGVLATSPQQYQRAHEFPGWYKLFEAFTAKSVEVEELTLSEVSRAIAFLGTTKAFVKDYTKSLKHEGASVISLEDPEQVLQGLEHFVELRGEYLAGNIIMREYMEFMAPEVRTWWVKGRFVLATAHPDTPTSIISFRLADLPQGFSEVMASADLPFVTADFARTSEGAWHLIEVGDGQVSDRPRSLPPGVFAEVVFGAR